MGGEVLQVIGEALALVGGFARADAERQRHVADVAGDARGGEREHVGGGVLAPERGVECAQARVVCKQDGEAGGLGLRFRGERRGGGRPGEDASLWLGGAPGPCVDDDLDHRPAASRS